MGVSYSATVIFGVKVDESMLYTTKVVKTFEHDYPKDWVADPKSGRPLWKKVREPIDGYDPDAECLLGYQTYCTKHDIFVVLMKTQMNLDYTRSPACFAQPHPDNIERFNEALKSFSGGCSPEFYLIGEAN